MIRWPLVSRRRLERIEKERLESERRVIFWRDEAQRLHAVIRGMTAETVRLREQVAAYAP